MLGLAGVQPESDLEVELARPCLVGQRFRRGECPLHGVRRRVEDRDGRVAFAHRLEEAAAVCFDGLRDQFVVANQRRCHGIRVLFPERGRPFDVGQAERHDAGRERFPPAGPQALDEFAGRLGSPGGIGGEAEADYLFEVGSLLLVDAVPRWQYTRRHRPGQQCERSGRERVDVACPRWRAACHQLGARYPGVPARRHCASGTDDMPKSTSLTPPTSAENQVAGLHVTVDDRRVLSVQIGESVGRVGQVCEHARWSKSGLPASAQQPREVGAVDPVHGDDVVVGIEEVLAHEGKRGMRRELEQNPCLSQQVLPIRRVAHGAELERDEPIVLVVEGLEDPPLAARSQRFQELVALAAEAQSSHPRHAMRLSYAMPHGGGDRGRVGRAQRASRAAVGSHDGRDSFGERHRARRSCGEPSPRRFRTLSRRLVRDRRGIVQRNVAERRAHLVNAARTP